MIMMRFARFVVPAVAAAGIALVAVPAPAVALTPSIRYAAPNGTGTACTQAAPCDIVEAVNNAPTGAEVQIGSGVYGSKAHPLDTVLEATSDQIIHGDEGRPMPVIYSAGQEAFSVDNSSLSWVNVIFSGQSVGIAGTDIGHVVVLATQEHATACEIAGSLIDALCVATGKFANALWADTSSSGSSIIEQWSVKDSTLIAPDSTSQGLLEQAGEHTTIDLTATNTIFEGGDSDLFIQSTNATGHTNITIDHSAYRTGRVDIDTGMGSENVTRGPGNVHPATFVNAAAGDFREQATSDTVDAGVASGTTTDVVGEPRTLGSAPDIGAFEYVAPPAIHAVKVTKRKKHSFTVSAKVNGEGVPTAAKVSVKPGKGSTDYAQLPGSTTSTKDHKIKVKITGLKSHQTYHVKILARNAGGTSQHTAKHASTKH